MKHTDETHMMKHTDETHSWIQHDETHMHIQKIAGGGPRPSHALGVGTAAPQLITGAKFQQVGEISGPVFGETPMAYLARVCGIM